MFFKPRTRQEPTFDRFGTLVRMIDRTQARVEFSPDAHLRWANALFCQTLGYPLEELIGKPHATFCPPDLVQSAEYRDFWDRLRNGESFSGEFERVAKSGQRIWISATYAPLLDAAGSVIGVAKIAHDITARKIAVQRISDAVESLARNDLSVRLDLPEDSGFGGLAGRFNDAISRLATGLERTRATLDFLEDAARDSAGQAEQVADRARADAAEGRLTAEAVSGAAGALTEAAGLVTRCLHGVRSGVGTVQGGSQAMTDAVSATRVMQEQARALGDINALIDDLSFQTSLLALNAGVEAARAGPAGTGFSVVAAEIRGLAHRSAEASGDIATRVRAIVDLVSGLAGSVERSDTVFRRLAQDLGSISGDMEQVAAATQVQAQALSRSSGSIDGLTQSLESTVDMAHRQAAASRGHVGRLDETARDLRDWWAG